MPSAEPEKRDGVATRIVAHLAAPAKAVSVSDVRIGLGYTAVMLADRRIGVAFTFRAEAKGGCSVFQGLRPLADRPASELLSLLKSSDPIEAGVGLACANALANGTGDSNLDGDVLDHLDLRPTDRVGMVGHFGPLVGALDERVRTLTVFERIRQPNGRIRPIREAEEILPHCQVALITATAIMNGTIDGLLQLAARCREVAVLGASTPMLPGAFPPDNATMLSGVVVKEAADVLRVVSEGGGMRQFSPYVRKVCMRVARSKTR